ncbi:MAG: hypothetical protein RMJ55_19930, partial [Roseiflexaceae bacterium]|nr:hypothetical protein [Roseiflexaceae bacterium]
MTRYDQAQSSGRVSVRWRQGRAARRLLTAEPVAEPAQLWAEIAANVRRRRIELIWRKSELVYESSRVGRWEERPTRMVLALRAQAFWSICSNRLLTHCSLRATSRLTLRFVSP